MCLAAAHSFLPLFLKGVVWSWHQRDDRECTILTKHPLSFHRHASQLWHLHPTCQMTGHRAAHSFFRTCSLLLFLAMNPLSGKMKMTVAIPASADGPSC